MTETPKVPTGVLERGLLLLSCFTQAEPRLRLRELSAKTGLDKATTLRALKTLVAWSFLEKGQDGSYSPGPVNLRLAEIFKTTSNFINRLEVPIVSISKRVGQTTSFFVRSNEERICLVRDNAYRDYRRFIAVGASVALSEGGSAAQILLAYTEPDSPEYERIRRDGYYISHGDRNKQFLSIAVPLFESDGSFLGAVSVTGMKTDLDEPTLIKFSKVIAEEVKTAGFRSEHPE